MNFLLVGAGGHAKAVVEAILAAGDAISAYVDPKKADWLDERQYTEDIPDSDDNSFAACVLGLGGVAPAALERRLALMMDYRSQGIPVARVVHPAAYVSNSASLGDGAVVLAGAVVQPGAAVGEGAIVNTGAIVEHDSEVGDGAHVAPGAIILGGCRIGRCAMIGAGAVILSGVSVPSGTLVPAGKRQAS